jgi:hypothetical protein
MPYCNKCGAKLDDDARFCRVCGTPVVRPAPYNAPAPAPVSTRRNSYLLPVAVLVAILLAAFIVGFLVLVPFTPVNFNQGAAVPAIRGVDNLNIDFRVDVGQVNVFIRNLPGEMAAVNVTANGSVGLFANSSQPVELTLNPQTIGTTEVVTSTVSRPNTFFTSDNLNVTCNIYINPAANLNLTIRSTVGTINMNASAPTTIQALNLQSTTGNVQAGLIDGVFIAGNVSATSTTGNVQMLWNNPHVEGNTFLSLKTTTGNVNLNATQNKSLNGNVSVDAKATTGGVSLNMNISDTVGAFITYHTSLGGSNVIENGFSGSTSPLQSANFPSTTNFIVDLETTTGRIHVLADYKSSLTSS